MLDHVWELRTNGPQDREQPASVGRGSVATLSALLFCSVLAWEGMVLGFPVPVLAIFYRIAHTHIYDTSAGSAKTLWHTTSTATR